MERWRIVARLAAGQSGLIAAWQAAEAGIGRDSLVRYAKERGWIRVAHGVYLLPGFPRTPQVRLKTVELALRRPLAFSHDSAAFLWDLKPSLPNLIHVVTNMRRSLRCEGVRVHRVTAFDRMTVTTRSSLPVLGAPETLCTLAAITEVDEFVRLLGKADRMRIASPARVEEVAGGLGKFRGRVTLREALDRIRDDGLSHSDLERLARKLFQEAGLVPHGRPYTVLDNRGRMIAEVDIAFIEAKVAVAVDGPHHGEAGQRRLDEDQRQELEALGWIVVRADEFRLTREPDKLVRQVRSALARATN